MDSFIGKLRQVSSNKKYGTSMDGSKKYEVDALNTFAVSNTFGDDRRIHVNIGDDCDDLGQPTTSNYQIPRKSAMVYNYSETLRDSGAMAYFIQFMEGIGQLDLIKFWLHVESFKVSACSIKRCDDALIEMMRRDAEAIYSKYIAKDSPCSIGITSSLRNKIGQLMNQQNGTINSTIFREAQNFVRATMENRFFVEFQSSIYYAKHRLDVISSGSFSISDIIKCQPLLSAFVEYMESEGERKLIEFIISVESFNERLVTYDTDEQSIEDAMIIYNKYFSMQASEPLKFGTKTRIQIESDICTEEGRPAIGCFDAARNMAVRILEQNYLKRFSASPAFVKYIKELVAQVDRMEQLPDSNHNKKTIVNGSDQSSDVSVTSLLDKASYRSITHLSTSRLNLMSNEEDETTSQFDSISISSFGTCSSSRRGRSRVDVSLATVDDMGRYRPMYDNSYSSSGDNGLSRLRIKNKLGKLLRQTTKKEADIADQVAQLIVADVHNMVSAGSSSNLAS